jgi:uncharacterized protein
VRFIAMFQIPQIGIGIQYNSKLIPWFPFVEQPLDAFEIFLDNLTGALDGPHLAFPGAVEALEPLRARATLIAHSNYGGDFGFLPLEQTAAVRRHAPLARMLDSPWVTDHCFYSDDSSSDIWSSPLQLSRAELKRLVARARALQDIYGMPLCHENAAYYFPFPGGDMPEAEFLAGLVDGAGTYLNLDLHNVYTNSVNLPGYRCDEFLATIPLDRVVEVHIGGGSYVGGVYHDWHDSKIPGPVWEMLEQVLQATRVGAVILEFQGRAHHESARVLTPEEDLEMIIADLSRAGALWDRVYGPGSRRSTRTTQADQET